MAPARGSIWRKTTIALGLTAAVAAVAPALPADAKSKPNLKQLEAQLKTLQIKVDTLTDQYDGAVESLTKAKKQLAVYTQLVKADQGTYNELRVQVVQLAQADYKNSGGTGGGQATNVVASSDPAKVLDQMSVITAITQDRTSLLSQFVASAEKLKAAQTNQKITINQIKATQASLKSQAVTLKAQTEKQARLVIAAGGPAPQQGTCNVTAASTAAQRAIEFACSKLGTPYLWGGTGPRYDCSGLTQAAWRAAGISLPRTSQEQFTVYKRVSYDQLQPGDLVFFESSIGHVGMYLGGGRMVHSPHTGDVVRITDISSGFYRGEFEGGVHIA